MRTEAPASRRRSVDDKLSAVTCGVTEFSVGRRAVGGISVVLLDDHEIVERSVRPVLEAAGIEVVGESESAAEARRRDSGPAT